MLAIVWRIVENVSIHKIGVCEKSTNSMCCMRWFPMRDMNSRQYSFARFRVLTLLLCLTVNNFCFAVCCSFFWIMFWLFFSRRLYQYKYVVFITVALYKLRMSTFCFVHKSLKELSKKNRIFYFYKFLIR